MTCSLGYMLVCVFTIAKEETIQYNITCNCKYISLALKNVRYEIKTKSNEKESVKILGLLSEFSVFLLGLTMLTT